MKNVLIGILCLGLVLGLGWAFTANDWLLSKTFAPKMEQVRRDTFEQSKAYNQGMIQELQNMQFEYVKASASQQEALGSIILHRAADYDVDKMPPDLRGFIGELRAKQAVAR